MLAILSKVTFSLCLEVFLLLSVSSYFFEGLGDESRGRRQHLSLGLSASSGVQITSCLGNVITNFLWRQMQGLLLGARVDVTPTAPSCTSGVRL